mmetsp:Transcript_26994/g.59510  ORF Transcript_26994/g.59510 Transcript_26994/m.59510 type:complete len:107 (-) Transcript_26994:1228-1548(-)
MGCAKVRQIFVCGDSFSTNASKPCSRKLYVFERNFLLHDDNFLGIFNFYKITVEYLLCISTVDDCKQHTAGVLRRSWYISWHSLFCFVYAERSMAFILAERSMRMM